jgi:hypothetical protein
VILTTRVQGARGEFITLLFPRYKMEKTKKEFNKTQEIVLDILKNDERSRNDDKWLTYLVMRKFTNIYIPFEDFNKIPSFETIRRVRQKIQNTMCQYMPTNDKVINKRHLRERFVRNWAKE